MPPDPLVWHALHTNVVLFQYFLLSWLRCAIHCVLQPPSHIYVSCPSVLAPLPENPRPALGLEDHGRLGLEWLGEVHTLP